jgi:hypothetical protein
MVSSLLALAEARRAVDFFFGIGLCTILLTVGVGLWRAREDKPTDYQGRKPSIQVGKARFFARLLVGGILLLVLVTIGLRAWIK